MGFKPGNTYWKSNPKFKENICQLTSEKVKSPEFQEKRQAGHDQYKALNRIKKDIFKQLTGDDKLALGIERILKDAIIDGNTKQFVDLLKLVTPKELDITSDGKGVQMGMVVVDGSDLELNIGDEVSEEDED